MDVEETAEEECLTILGWSVEEVALSTLDEMLKALHENHLTSTQTTFVPTIVQHPFVSTDLLERIKCLQKRMTIQNQLVQTGGIGSDDSAKFKQGMETDNRLLQEDKVLLVERLKSIEVLLGQKKQSLEIVDDLLRFTHKVQGLGTCLSRDAQHKKDIVEEIKLLHMESNMILKVV
jgi:hypothetical protein